MSESPEQHGPITPYLPYEDGDKAVDWLVSAFGFTERMRMHMPDGTVGHAELEHAGGLVMLATPGGYRSPVTDGRRSDVMVHVYVDDVDAHFARARDAGATIVDEPSDQPYGDRRYVAADPEGHVWMIATHVRDVGDDWWKETS
jgi:PhnB protein